MEEVKYCLIKSLNTALYEPSLHFQTPSREERGLGMRLGGTTSFSDEEGSGYGTNEPGYVRLVLFLL